MVSHVTQPRQWLDLVLLVAAPLCFCSPPVVIWLLQQLPFPLQPDLNFKPHCLALSLLCCLQVSYRQLLDVFFNRVDPTTLNRQGNDRGTQYRSVICTHDDEQRQQAEKKIAEVNKQLSEVSLRQRMS